jgi:hypothetical protein
MSTPHRSLFRTYDISTSLELASYRKPDDEERRAGGLRSHLPERKNPSSSTTCHTPAEPKPNKSESVAIAVIKLVGFLSGWRNN